MLGGEPVVRRHAENALFGEAEQELPVVAGTAAHPAAAVEEAEDGKRALAGWRHHHSRQPVVHRHALVDCGADVRWVCVREFRHRRHDPAEVRHRLRQGQRAEGVVGVGRRERGGELVGRDVLCHVFSLLPRCFCARTAASRSAPAAVCSPEAPRSRSGASLPLRAGAASGPAPPSFNGTTVASRCAPAAVCSPEAPRSRSGASLPLRAGAASGPAPPSFYGTTVASRCAPAAVCSIEGYNAGQP